jgi:NAD(P)-dependent dehydrogenase (short-subunit alcohol dehydrogenase family)
MKGSVVYISGGTSGINLAIARAFVTSGAKVLVFGRDQAKATAAADSLNRIHSEHAIGASADVRDSAAVDSLFEDTTKRLGSPDVVIAGAAGNFLAAASELSANAFRTVVDIDLMGTFNVFRAGYRCIRKPGGVLLAISAPQGSSPTKNQAHVCAAKAGVNMLVKCLAFEWGAEGIRVNAISPGPISGTEGVERMAPGPAEKSAWAARIALGRFGTLDEIATAVIFLAGPAASYVTGTVIDFDGGCQLGNVETG